MAELIASAEGFALKGELSLDTVPGLFEQTRQAVAGSKGACRVDLQHVTRTDSAGLALLVSIARLCCGQGSAVRMDGAPGQLLALARANKVDRLLGLG